MFFVSSRLGYWLLSCLKLNVNTVCKFWLLQKLAVHFLEGLSLCSNLSITDSQRTSSSSSLWEQKVQALATWDIPVWSRRYLSRGQCKFQWPRWGVRWLEVPHSLPLQPSYVGEHPPEEIKCIVESAYLHEELGKHLSFILPDQRSLLFPWIPQTQTQFWLSECQRTQRLLLLWFYADGTLLIMDSLRFKTHPNVEYWYQVSLCNLPPNFVLLWKRAIQRLRKRTGNWYA